MKYGAAFLTPGTAAASIVDELLPGAHVVVFGDDLASIEARKAGLHFRDSVLVLSHGPRSELLSIFRKPIIEDTVALQAIKTGTGGLHIDACRVGLSGGTRKVEVERYRTKGNSLEGSVDGSLNGGVKEDIGAGRWPPNLLLVHAPDCKNEGVRRVKSSNPTGQVCRGEDRVRGVYMVEDPNSFTGNGSRVHYADPDGMETVAAWTCVPGCARGALDALSGQLRARGNVTPTKRRQSDGVTGWGVGPDGETDPGDGGGASRFFPQFVSREALFAWLEVLLLPPGGLLFFR